MHLQQSIDVTAVPFKEPVLKIKTQKVGESTITTLVEPPISPYFSVYKWDVAGELSLTRGQRSYVLASVIAGSGSLEVDGKVYDIKKGTNFILPHDIKEWTLTGNLSLVASNPAES
ncbi:hypothetical protein FD21_GL000980 [Liquorilactobacillus vini DSM 20605]|uniref:Phosphohexomutase n=1 Tax=Liquorilactobacillus vini DSM 20605 TaxID=1133569 RepID=A0A0R2CBD3_9LACO|nr:hypothetical protein FD21_GL000980 [Liquorilactobacillus vini DSM 20605]